MRKLRQYCCLVDTGRDFINFYFWSEHKANSYDNLLDAKKSYYKDHHTNVKVISSWLVKGVNVL